MRSTLSTMDFPSARALRSQQRRSRRLANTSAEQNRDENPSESHGENMDALSPLDVVDESMSSNQESTSDGTKPLSSVTSARRPSRVRFADFRGIEEEIVFSERDEPVQDPIE